MIPKIIHYCWFGRGEKNKRALKCIASWKKYCPDYQIIEWNEDNFDINYNAYTRFCYENRKYAFLTDYLRLLIVYEHGGIYFDTDVELVKSFDPLLADQAFIGFETKEKVNTGQGFGAEQHNPVVKQMIAEYEPLMDGLHGTVGCPDLNTQALLPFGLKQDGTLQDMGHIRVYPPDFFNPYDDPTGRLTKTANTCSIHWYGKSWMSRKSKIRSFLMKPVHRILGTNLRKTKK